jgi:hypothetical protein
MEISLKGSRCPVVPFEAGMEVDSSDIRSNKNNEWVCQPERHACYATYRCLSCHEDI